MVGYDRILSNKIRRHAGVPPSSVVFNKTAVQNYLRKFWSEKNGGEDCNKIDWIQKQIGLASVGEINSYLTS